MAAQFLTLTIGVLVVFAVIAALAAGAAIRLLSGSLARSKAVRLRSDLSRTRPGSGPAR